MKHESECKPKSIRSTDSFHLRLVLLHVSASVAKKKQANKDVEILLFFWFILLDYN